MAKQLNVNLSFTADTGKARQQLQDLQQSLSKLISSANGKTAELGLTKELAQAASEASKLKIMLESAMTPSGTLDLGKFSQGLKKSGLELKDYANTLQTLGPEGAKTFAKLAQSITTANVPLKQTNRLLDEFATTMKNTVRWQFSSSMLHGFMGAMSGALGYAKDLDKSLNDIRIVTGYNIDQMAQFATEANKAAKALSSTTTDYTNASLIYYQQGLGEEEIAKRTEVTLKMANAAGVSAQTVSDQMTAVWNNFDDGSKSLEYYADVMTALGAATASSTDEISQGLNKFAAVAETVGLSYEYATAALATVTATTRESADVVGTAFKTLFARIQGLNLGETLDDGTTLNKYSNALAKVGISIFEANGEMKSMNNILDEMGAKWGTMSKDQQTALAQTVAGVRQYTQLMALMNNWDYFKENVEVAKDSTGTLQKQADIYAESWEASAKRVKAASEGIYDKLLDEKFFIGVNNILEGTLSHVGNLIDGLGGLPGVLSIISSLMLKAFGKDIATSLERFAYNIKLTSKTGQEEILAIRKKANKELREMYSDSSSPSDAAKADMVQRQADLQDALIDKAFELEKQNKTLTEEEQKRAQLLLEQNNALSDQYSKISELKDTEEAKVEKLVSSIERISKVKTVDVGERKNVNVSQELKEIKELNSQYNMGMTLLSKYKQSSQKAFESNDVDKQKVALQQVQKHLQMVREKALETGNSVTHLEKAFKAIEGVRYDETKKAFVDTNGEIVEMKTLLEGMKTELDEVGADAYNRFELLGQALQNAGADMQKLNPQLKEIWASFERTGELTEQQIQIFANYGIQVDKAGNIIKNFSGKVYTTADSLVAVANIMTNFASVVNSIKGLSDVWSDEDLSYGEKILSTFTSLGMVLSTLVTTYSNFNKVKLLGFKNDIASLAIKQGLISAEVAENGAQAVENGLLTTQIALKAILNALDLKKIAIYAALALAVGAVVAIGKILYDQYHADAQGAKEAAEQVEVLTERYEELKNKAQELNDAIADYQDARDALADLEKGTDEYAAALENANNKAKELIETYGLWDSYEYKDGVITIDPKALEDAQKEAEQAVDQAQTQMYQGQIYANQASLRNETTNLQRQGKTFGTGTYTTHYTEHGSYTSENYRKLSNQEVQAVAQVASELQASLGGVTPTAEQLIARLNELGTNSGLGSDALANLSSIITADSISGFLSLGESMSEAEKANRYYAEQILGMAIEDKYGDKITAMATDETGSVNESKYNQILSAFTNRAAAAEEQKGNDITARYGEVESEVKDIVNTGDLNSFLDKYENDADSNKLINDVIGGNYDGKINNDEELGLLYAQMISGIDKSELTYKAGNGVGTVKDKEGNEIVAGVSDEVMRREIAKQVAMQQITNDYADSVDGNVTSLEQLENALNTLITGASKAEKDFGVDFSSAILDAIANEDFDSLDFSGLFSELDPEEMARLSGLDSQGILDLLGLDAPTLQALGYDVDTFTSAFSNALDDWTYTLDTTDIEEKAAGLKDIADDIKVGDIIDQEAYDKLIAAGINADQYFTQMEDGTYKLIGSAKEFQKIVEGITVQDYIDKIKEYESASQYAQNKINENYNNNPYISKHLFNSNVTSGNQMGAARVEYIKTFEGDFGFSEEQLALLNKDPNSYTAEDLREIAEMMDIVAGKSVEMQGQLLSTADSLDELYATANTMQQAGIGLNSEAWQQALIGLASQYENCADEIEEFQKAVIAGNPEAIKAAEELLEASIMIGEAAETFGIDAEVAETQAKQLAKAYGLDAKAASKLAIANARMNKGVESLNDNWKDWKKALSKTDKTTLDYADALNDVTAAIGDLIGASEDFELPDGFIDSADNLALIEKAAKGDKQAIELLGVAVSQAQIEMMEFNESMVAMAQNSDLLDSAFNLDTFNTYKTEVLEGITALQNAIQNGTLTAGQNITSLLDGAGANWVDSLNQMALATGMSVQQMNALLNQLGVQAKVDVVDVKQSMKVPTYTEYSTVSQYSPPVYDNLGNVLSPPTWSKQTWTVPGPSKEVDGYVQVAQISTEGGDIGPPQITYTGHGSVAPSITAPSTGGGGGGKKSEKEPSKPKKIEVTGKEEVVERYKEVNDALDDLADEYEKASRSADRLWGENRLDAIREQNKLIEEQQELLKEKQRQAENYMNQDRAALNQAAAEAGLSFSYDDKGNITNYTDQMTILYNQLAAAENHYKSLATGEEQDAYEETVLGPLRDKISKVEDAIAIYEESKELFEELGLDIDELQDQIMQNNYDIIMEGLELHISFNEEDLENIDYYLSKLEDDFYSMAEAAALMVGTDGSSQLNEYLSNLEEYSKAMDDLHKAYANGEITEAAYQEGLKEIRDNIRDNLSSLLELDKAMMEYYGETLAMAQEELAKYTDRMQQQTEVLQHYGNMMEILGKQLDYDSMGVILQGQVDTIENEMNIAEAAYNMYKQQAEEKRALYEEAMKNNDFAAAELYKKEWEAAQEAADEAQSEMLSKTEEWAEAMRVVVENKLAGLAKSLEEALTGGTSFDQINLQLERAVSLQEEYLTTTNQIYETNKLMRTAQQAIDKSTNLVAKQRLKDFIKETDQLQDKAKLSQYELEIQQAKYNLLLAEIALEDAQNAKSTVRLQRDSEGNFGYVYTSDQTQLAQAQQELEDAQNSLYNIGLEGASDYTEKYTQTMQEMYDTLTSITEAYYNGEITSQEDYEAQMLAAQEYYYQQLENYQDLYGIALQTDTRVIQDSWTSSFRTMINNTENWKIKVNDYSMAASQSLFDWYSKVEEISQKTGLDNIANNVKKVTDESKALRDIVLGTEGEPGVISALQQELKEVSDLTKQYATFRTTLQGVITEYEKLINAANRLAEANAKAGVNNPSNDDNSSSPKNNTSSQSNNNNSSNSNNVNNSSSDGGSSNSSGTQVANKYKATYNLRGKSNTISGYYSEGAARAAAESAINSAVNALTGITFSEKNDIATSARGSIQIARYNTGGYTGSWGPYGKLGILDEKELILNPEDTENFLASMKVLERILEIIDLQAVSSQLGGTLLTPSIGNSITSQSLEQSVHIEASFPSVQDRNEIEEAFNTLINKASQYANRK